jgi:hypothetical protein
MIASVHKYRAALPGSRAELYREICQVFLGKRREAKHLPVAQSIEQQLLVLSRLAFGMMIGRVRDITAEEAGVMIEPVLQRIGYMSGTRMFLQETEHGSGLLVERDTGMYSFAHLTFQEYLAALHIAEQLGMDFLVGQLQDSWWREVILFRVATADATAILEAILATSGPSVQLLSLADECLVQARDIEAAVRKDAQELLSWRDDASPAQQRRIAYILLRRKMRRVIRTATGAFVCPVPVTGAEYAMFLRALPGDSELRTLAEHCAPSGDAGLAVGIYLEIAKAFVEWAQSIGVAVRLPDYSDLKSDLRRLAVPPELQFWVRAAVIEDLPLLASYRGSLDAHMMLTAPQGASTDAKALESLLEQQIIIDLDSVLAWHDFHVPPYFSLANKRMVGDWKRFSGEREITRSAVANMRFFDAPFPDALLERIMSPDPARQIVQIGDSKDFLRRYRLLFPGLLRALHSEWETGGYWRVASELLSQAAPYPNTTMLAGNGTEALYLRAYLRLMAWEPLLDVPTIIWRPPDGASQTGDRGAAVLPEGRSKFVPSASQRRDIEAVKVWAMYDLARQYLSEWRNDGTLPPVEGIILARA